MRPPPPLAQMHTPSRKQWQVLLPWSQDGLGGADKYLGMIALGMPASGGAYPPGGLCVSDEAVIAVGDTSCDLTRLYDRWGKPLGARPGMPIGFLPGGVLVVSGDGENALTVYAADGELLWIANPGEHASFSEQADTSLQVIGGGGTYFVNPLGEVFAHESRSYGRLVQGQVPYWQSEKSVDATIVYGLDGAILRTRNEIGARPIFTPHGTVFFYSLEAGHESFAHREFEVDNGDWVASRTILLPLQSLAAHGQNGDFLCRAEGDAGGPEGLIYSFEVYREGADSGIAFSLPVGHYPFQLWNGFIWTFVLQEDGLLITCWKWPVP